MPATGMKALASPATGYSTSIPVESAAAVGGELEAGAVVPQPAIRIDVIARLGKRQ